MNRLIDELKITIARESQKKVLCSENGITIKENDRNAKLKAINIIDLKKNDDTFFGFSLDIEGMKQLAYCIDRKNFNRGCDGIIFIKRGKKVYIIICELKSSKPKAKDFVNQMKSSEAFVYYLCKALIIFDKISIDNDNKKIPIIKVLFDTSNVSKPQTRSGKNSICLMKKDEQIYKADCIVGTESRFFIDQLIKLKPLSYITL